MWDLQSKEERRSKHEEVGKDKQKPHTQQGAGQKELCGAGAYKAHTHIHEKLNTKKAKGRTRKKQKGGGRSESEDTCGVFAAGASGVNEFLKFKAQDRKTEGREAFPPPLLVFSSPPSRFFSKHQEKADQRHSKPDSM